MGKILIRRKVNFDFLGDEYKDAYISFRAIPVKDYQDILKKMPTEDQADNGKSVALVLDTLKEYFVEGKFPGADGTLESLEAGDLDDLDQDSAIRCFEVLVGRQLDPKDELTSTTPSTTAA